MTRRDFSLRVFTSNQKEILLTDVQCLRPLLPPRLTNYYHVLFGAQPTLLLFMVIIWIHNTLNTPKDYKNINTGFNFFYFNV